MKNYGTKEDFIESLKGSYFLICAFLVLQSVVLSYILWDSSWQEVTIWHFFYLGASFFCAAVLILPGRIKHYDIDISISHKTEAEKKIERKAERKRYRNDKFYGWIYTSLCFFYLLEMCIFSVSIGTHFKSENTGILIISVFMIIFLLIGRAAMNQGSEGIEERRKNIREWENLKK
jgi:hydrogenase-4 membrane subunit HyfE